MYTVPHRLHTGYVFYTVYVFYTAHRVLLRTVSHRLCLLCLLRLFTGLNGQNRLKQVPKSVVATAHRVTRVYRTPCYMLYRTPFSLFYTAVGNMPVKHRSL